MENEMEIGKIAQFLKLKRFHFEFMRFWFGAQYISFWISLTTHLLGIPGIMGLLALQISELISLMVIISDVLMRNPERFEIYIY